MNQSGDHDFVPLSLAKKQQVKMYWKDIKKTLTGDADNFIESDFAATLDTKTSKVRLN